MLSRCLVLTLLASAVVQAGLLQGAEIATLKGEVLKAEVESVSDTELVLSKDGMRQTRPIAEILKIDFREMRKPGTAIPYSDLELTDGTILHCSKWALKKAEVEATLLAGPVIKVPLAAVSSILNNAQEESNRKDWSSRTAGKRTSDVMVVKRETVIQGVQCTFGEGDDSGESIEVTATIAGETITRRRKLASLHGLIFKRTLDPNAPAVTCKMLDTMQDVVMVSSVRLNDKGLTVSTPAGARLELPTEALARLDYAKGKLEYLSDLEPMTLITRSNVEDSDRTEQQYVYKDVSLKRERTPLTLGGKTFAKGLALRPYTELIFDLKGDYREFSATVGLDDNVGASGDTILVIEGDGTVLETIKVNPADKKKFHQVKRNIKDVQRLRLIVQSGDEFDLGKHIDLADAKVSK